MNKNVLITGASGFIGQYLAIVLERQGFTIFKTGRSIQPGAENTIKTGDINADTDWQHALENIDIVVHLAARVHVMQELESDPLHAFRQVNTAGTLNLARQAQDAGVRRFIYLSSIKVNGEATTLKPFNADGQANPLDPYAVSKYEAECQLLELGANTGLEVVIIRPPLVYGPGVKGNFLRLLKLVDKTLPLPLAKIDNKRSMVNIENLCSLIERCMTHEKAQGEVFLVSDGTDLSTSELIAQMAQAMHKTNRMFYLPRPFLYWLTRLLNRNAEFERLFGSLQVDIGKNASLLGWQPFSSPMQGIQQTVNWYMQNK